MNKTVKKISLFTSFTVVIIQLFLIVGCKEPEPTKPPQPKIDTNIPTKGLVAYYPFNNNANDESGNGNNGSYNGTINFIQGRKGDALSLGGVSNPGYISVANSSSLKFTNNSATISYWFKRTNPNGQTWADCSGSVVFGAEHVIISKSCDRYGFSCRTGITKDTLTTCDISIDLFSPTATKPSFITSIKMGTWVHVVFTISSNGTRSYLNGQLVNETTTPVSFERMNNEPMYIGIQGGKGSCLPWWGRFQGLIDEVCIYNRVLSDSEIQQLYHAGN